MTRLTFVSARHDNARGWIGRGILTAVLAAGGLWAGLPSQTVWAATIGVNTTIDEYNTDGDCSLREAIIAANTDTAVDACPAGSGADVIQIPSGVYTLTLAGTGEDASATGDLDINESATLIGVGPTTPLINANGLDRVFHLGATPTSVSVTLARLNIRGGSTGTAAGAGINVYRGSLTMTNVRLFENSGTYSGSGSYAIFSGTLSGTIDISDSLIDASSGGLLVGTGVHAVIRRSLISNNTVIGSGSGGGIVNNGDLTLVNSTLSGNSSEGDGGGLANNGTAELYNVTIAANVADSDANASGSGGGIFQGSGTLTLRNTLIGDNTLGASPAGADCSGTLTTAGHNLIEDLLGCTLTGTGTGDLTGIAPAIAPLADNGGLSFTHALQSSSDAIDAGDPLGCTDETSAPLTVDQRNDVRTGMCDIGAYEYGSIGTPTPTATATSTPTRTPTPTATATSSGPTSIYLPSIQR